jgi:hypothetical protein
MQYLGLAELTAGPFLAPSSVCWMICIVRMQRENCSATIALKRLRPFVLRNLHHNGCDYGIQMRRMTNRALGQVMVVYWQVINQVARVTHRKNPKTSRNEGRKGKPASTMPAVM